MAVAQFLTPYIPYLYKYVKKELPVPVQDVLSKFEYAVGVVLKHEGVLSTNKNDPGGITKYGISLAFLKHAGLDVNYDGDINEMDVLAITPSKAKEIYKTMWWDRYQYELINDIDIATKTFDLSVNMGNYAAHKLLQKAINNVTDTKVEVDGIIGKQTLTALNNIINKKQDEQLLNTMRDLAAQFYINLATKHPLLKEFLNGWLRRAAS